MTKLCLIALFSLGITMMTINCGTHKFSYIRIVHKLMAKTLPKSSQNCGQIDLLFCKFLGIIISLKSQLLLKCFRFRQRKQHDVEYVIVYIAELWQLSINCEFWNTLNDMLRDRLVCGLSNPKIQKALLDEKKLTFAKNQWYSSLNGTSRRECKKSLVISN